MKVEDLDYDHLPKWVIAKINPKRDIIDFGKIYVQEEVEGVMTIRVNSWCIPIWPDAAEAKAVLEKEKADGTLEEGMEVWHLDDLHKAFAAYLGAPKVNCN